MPKGSIHHRASRTPSARTGRRGEHVACAYLAQQGYSILTRNVRVGHHDEVDIIAFDPSDAVIVFAEVKTRTRSDPHFTPELNLTTVKRTSMARAARRWVAQHGWHGGYRMDLLCVTGASVTDHYRELSWHAIPRLSRL